MSVFGLEIGKITPNMDFSTDECTTSSKANFQPILLDNKLSNNFSYKETHRTFGREALEDWNLHLPSTA